MRCFCSITTLSLEVTGKRDLADTLLDQRGDCGDVVRSYRSDARVDVQAGDEVHLGHIDLLNGQVTLEVQHLVKAHAQEALLDAFERGGGKVDTTRDDVA